MRTLTAAIVGSAALVMGQTVPVHAEAGSVDQQAVDMTGGKSGVPDKYDVVPVRAGELQDEKGGPLDKEVKNQQGETLGTIEKVMKDKKTGQIEYAVLAVADSEFQLPLQWSLFRQEGNQLLLKSTKEDLQAPVNSSLTKDHSPEISQFMDEINRVRQNPTGGQKGLGLNDQSHEMQGGDPPHGAEGGAGAHPGHALPPDGSKAPQFEGDNRPSSTR